MQNITSIQTTGNAVVRKNTLSLRTRIVLALAGTGCAGALLVGGLFGNHAAPQSAKASAPAATHAMVIQNAHLGMQALGNATYGRTAGAQNMTVSYKTSNGTYYNLAWQAALNAGISPQLFVNQIQQESGFNPRAYSPAGAEGIAQFMPATAASMGVNPWDPTSALYGAARLMANLNSQFGGNYAKALAAYNAGPGAVNSAVYRGGSNWLAYTPYETQNYVRVIMGW